MSPLQPLRLTPGVDLRLALQTWAAENGPAFVVAGIGSLEVACLRWADAQQAEPLAGPLEVLTLSGSLCADGAHLHASLADAQGRVCGGHVAAGCIVRTTMELVLAPLPGWSLSRVWDPATGYAELQVSRA